jgi:sugar O-acyltransferase (sialic acid O-acetyltransferase NeuD family)
MTINFHPIAIYGAGGLGREIAALIEQINQVALTWKIVGFFDDQIPAGEKINGIEVLGGIDAVNAWPEPLHVALAIGWPKPKAEIVSKINNSNITYPVLVHPTVLMGSTESISLGPGTIIAAGTILTVNIEIAEHVFFNLACTVGHDVKIGTYSSFMPSCNISGEVTVGAKTFWGTGAKTVNGVSVGDGATVGAGAVVIENIAPDTTVVGVPAKPVNS